MSENKKKCPYCAEMIDATVAKCPMCQEEQKKPNDKLEKESAPEAGNGIFKPQTAVNLSLLLSPIFGAWIIRKNWKNLGNTKAEKKSYKWFLGIIILTAISVISLEFEEFLGAEVIMLIIWYLLEAKPQIKYFKNNPPNISEENYKQIIKKPLIIYGICLAVLFVFSIIFGAPTLDCSSNQAFAESGEEIMEYLKNDLDFEEILERQKFGDNTEEDEAIVLKLAKLQHFFNTNQPGQFDDELKAKLNGMKANKLLDYIETRYDSFGNWK